MSKPNALISNIYSALANQFAINKRKSGDYGFPKKRKQTPHSRGLNHKKFTTIAQQRVYYREVYLRSAHWLAKRKAFLARHGRECMECRSTQNIQVHHLTYKNLGSERDVDLLVLCRECHKKAHGLTK